MAAYNFDSQFDTSYFICVFVLKEENILNASFTSFGTPRLNLNKKLLYFGKLISSLPFNEGGQLTLVLEQ